MSKTKKGWGRQIKLDSQNTIVELGWWVYVVHYTLLSIFVWMSKGFLVKKKKRKKI